MKTIERIAQQYADSAIKDDPHDWLQLTASDLNAKIYAAYMDGLSKGIELAVENAQVQQLRANKDGSMENFSEGPEIETYHDGDVEYVFRVDKQSIFNISELDD